MDTIQINHRDIPFELRKSTKAKRLRLQIDTHNPKVVLVVPRFTLKFQINHFLKRQASWIDQHWTKLELQIKERPVREHTEAYYKAKAKHLIRQRLKFFNEHYQFKYNRVSFRNQKTRWGSCSSEKNLNFNWRLILAPSEILDYVVVHELCHLSQMNHSKKFWDLVSQQVPDHKERKKWLKENSGLLSM